LTYAYMCIYTYNMAAEKGTKNVSKTVEKLIEALNSKLFKALSEPVRAELLKYLLINGRSDIGTIAENLPQDRSVISRHLSLMSEAGILRSEKEARHVYYEINGSAFLNEFEGIVENIKKCMCECCTMDGECT
jgi:DNA-binding transcriptional ArsR family regulator